MCNHFQGLVLFVGAVIYNIQHNRRARLVGTKSKTALEGVIHAKINHASGPWSSPRYSLMRKIMQFLYVGILIPNSIVWYMTKTIYFTTQIFRALDFEKLMGLNGKRLKCKYLHKLNLIFPSSDFGIQMQFIQ